MAFTSFSSSVISGSLPEIFNGAISLAVDRSDFLEELGKEDISQLDDNTGYIKNMLLVFFDEDTNLIAKLRALGSIGGTAVGSFKDANLCVVRTAGLNYEKLTALAQRAMSLDGVALASICPASRLEEQYTPNDPFTYDGSSYIEDWTEDEPSGNNWWLEAIDARGAWGYSNYFNKINIGVVDGGFDTSHPELEGKITFPNQMCARRNRVDMHGSHVAGIIAAKADNGIGISGICQNSSLICVDWDPSDYQLWIPEVEIFFGFGYAVKAGAKVINFSIGSSGSLKGGLNEYPSIIKNIDGMLYSYYMGSLLSKGYDFVVVQSSGNGNNDGAAVDASNNGMFCPITAKNAFLPFGGISVEDVLGRIIIVGNARDASGGTYIQSSSSNIGDRVDICAPGSNIFSCSDDGAYIHLSGTSMAAPVVTAVSSLVWSANPDLNGKQVKEIVCSETVDKVAPTNDQYFPELNYKEYGLVNAKAAVEAALKTKYTLSQVDLTLAGSPSTSVTFTDSDGREFVFETDSQGKLSCLLESGSYVITYSGSSGTEITVAAGENTFTF